MEDVIKQYIIMRTDLNMRKGKMIAQGAHASIGFLTRRIRSHESFAEYKNTQSGLIAHAYLSRDEISWIGSGFTKICVRVDSEEELMQIFTDASKLSKEQDVPFDVSLITDSGATEFHGKPTRTCLAIGPVKSSIIDSITGHLKLL